MPWWFILWTAWGAIIAGLVAWLDRNPLMGAAWFIAGVAIGSLPERTMELFNPWMRWYQGFWKDEARDFRLFQLTERRDFESDEFNRLMQDECFGFLLSGPLLVGIVHGTLLGGIGGALGALDPTVSLPAWQTAAIGVVAGIVGFSFLTGLVFGVAIVIGQWPGVKQPLRTRLYRASLMAISPLLVVPATWFALRYGLKWLQKRRAI